MKIYNFEDSLNDAFKLKIDLKKKKWKNFNQNLTDKN